MTGPLGVLLVFSVAATTEDGKNIDDGPHRWCCRYVRQRPPPKLETLMADQMSKWFCDTSTGAATGVARCGSFVVKRFSLLVISY
jgi:hypothetical protein